MESRYTWLLQEKRFRLGHVSVFFSQAGKAREYMSRKSCMDCVRKHLAQAQVLLDEAQLGYPHHRWLAVGHLAEAESECLDEHDDFARKIRECRLDVMQSLGKSKDACIESLLIEACLLAGEEADLQYDPRNSKVFDMIIEGGNR